MSPLTVALMSDVHLEFAPASLERTKADLHLFAGNVSKADPFGAARWCAAQIGDTYGVLVPGPDELQGFSRREAKSYMREAALGTRLNVLDRDSVVVLFDEGEIRVLGCTSPFIERVWLATQIQANPHVPTVIVTAIKPSPEEWLPVLRSANTPLWAYGGEHAFPLLQCENTVFANHPRTLTMGRTVSPASIPLSVCPTPLSPPVIKTQQPI